MTELEQRVVDFLKTVEGFRPEAYLDSAGVVTIGYGLARMYIGGAPINLGDTCIEQEANNWLEEYLEKFIYPPVSMLLDCLVNDGIYTALCSFFYNEGVCIRASILQAMKWVTVTKGDENSLNRLAYAFREYNKIRDKDGNLVVCPGLVNRREKEIALFLKDGEN